ncbi:MAG TPA: ABC transporter permease subunit [Candidatus Ozemobacteraceae bacterium]|mgnify:CR=1 FL=1|nr:ABC transporter permease subunit [Candidatus Ozemobacteraceae bacterium]
MTAERDDMAQSGTPKEFLKIREPVSITQSAMLGVLPICFILLVWTIATWGRMDIVYLPEGELDTGTPVPEIGRVITDGMGLAIVGWKLEQSATDTFLVNGTARFPLHNLYVRKYGDSFKIKLKRGRITGRTAVPAPAEAAGNEKSPPIGRGGTPVPQAAGKQTYVLEYTYEDIETRLLTQAILPSPMEVLRSLKSLWSERKLFSNVVSSFIRVAEGFFVALLLGFPLGLAMGSFSRIKAMFAPLVVFGGYLPIPALVPLFMSLFGTTELQKVMFLAFAFGIYLLPLFVRAIEEVDNVYLLTAYTLGANKWQTVRHVLLAISLPNLYDAMRMGFGVGWGYIILAEMVDMGSGGLGALILGSQRIGPKEHIYLVLLVIVTMAFITDKLWEYCGDRLFPYRRLKR